jgi:hypothetical protein
LHRQVAALAKMASKYSFRSASRALRENYRLC